MAATGRPFASRVLACRYAAGGGGGGFGGLGGGGFGGLGGSMGQPIQLFDHLVGAGDERRRHGEAERPGRYQIDDKLELGRLQHW